MVYFSAAQGFVATSGHIHLATEDGHKIGNARLLLQFGFRLTSNFLHGHPCFRCIGFVIASIQFLQFLLQFADGVFTGVGSTIYKTWFNDYAPLVINLLAEPFFMFTPRTANTFALLCALLIPSLVYCSAWLFLTVLRRKLQPKVPVLFTALSMAFVLLLPLLHIALYRGMPDLLGVAFDPKGGSFRREIFPEYKANRAETPEDILLSVPYVKRIVEAMCIPVLEV